MMKKDNLFFKTIPIQYFATFANEDETLMLCVCDNEEANTYYLCFCRNMNPEIQWSIASITLDNLYNLVANSVTLLQVLQEAKEKYIITLASEERCREAKSVEDLLGRYTEEDFTMPMKHYELADRVIDQYHLREK